MKSPSDTDNFYSVHIKRSSKFKCIQIHIKHVSNHIKYKVHTLRIKFNKSTQKER